MIVSFVIYLLFFLHFPYSSITCLFELDHSSNMGWKSDYLVTYRPTSAFWCLTLVLAAFLLIFRYAREFGQVRSTGVDNADIPFLGGNLLRRGG